MIITSYLFPSGTFSHPRLHAVLAALEHDTSKLVIDLSCRKKGDKWFVATDKWQTITDFELNQRTYVPLPTSISCTPCSRSQARTQLIQLQNQSTSLHPTALNS